MDDFPGIPVTEYQTRASFAVDCMTMAGVKKTAPLPSISASEDNDHAASDVDMIDPDSCPEQDIHSGIARPHPIPRSQLVASQAPMAHSQGSTSTSESSSPPIYFARYSTPTLAKNPIKDMPPTPDSTLGGTAATSTSNLQRSSFPNSQLPGRASALLNLHGQSPLRDQLQPFRTKWRKLSPLNPLAREESDGERERSTSRLSVESTVSGSDGGSSAPASATVVSGKSKRSSLEGATTQAPSSKSDSSVGFPSPAGMMGLPAVTVPASLPTLTAAPVHLHPAHVHVAHLPQASQQQQQQQATPECLPSPSGLISPPPLSLTPLHPAHSSAIHIHAPPSHSIQPQISREVPPPSRTT